MVSPKRVNCGFSTPSAACGVTCGVLIFLGVAFSVLFCAGVSRVASALMGSSGVWSMTVGCGSGMRVSI